MRHGLARWSATIRSAVANRLLKDPPAVQGEAGMHDKDSQEQTKKVLDGRLAHLAQERQAFLRDAKLSAIVLGVLLILVHDYASLVAADFLVEQEYSEQAQALVKLDGEVSNMSDVVKEHSAAWQQQADLKLELALRNVVELDRMETLDSPTGSPAFQDCIQKADESGGLVQTGEPPRAIWPRLLERCIIAPMSADVAWQDQQDHARPFYEARAELEIAIVNVRQAFPPTPTPMPTPATLPEVSEQTLVLSNPTPSATGISPAPSSPPAVAAATRLSSVSPTPAVPSPAPAMVSTVAVPTEVDRQPEPAVVVIVLTPPAEAEPTSTPTPVPLATIVADIEAEVAAIAAFVENEPDAVISTAPAAWLSTFGGEGGTLRSFRDNLLLAYADPFGEEPTTRDKRSIMQYRDTVTIGALTPSGRFPREGFAALLNDIRTKQEQLQTRIEERTPELEEAVPDFVRPVLAVARPKYLVHLYPLLVTGVSMYLLINFVNFRRDTRGLKQEYYDKTGLPVESFEAGAPELPWTLFLVISVAPVLLLLYLLDIYDWPQFGDIRWARSHQFLIGVLIALIFVCTVALFVTRNVTEADAHRWVVTHKPKQRAAKAK